MGKYKFCMKRNLVQEQLQTISIIFDPTKENKTIHYMPVMWGEMNGRLVKAKFNFPRIILDYGASSSIILGKHMQKLRKKMTKTVRWSTQGGDFYTNYTSKL